MQRDRQEQARRGLRAAPRLRGRLKGSCRPTSGANDAPMRDAAWKDRARADGVLQRPEEATARPSAMLPTYDFELPPRLYTAGRCDGAGGRHRVGRGDGFPGLCLPPARRQAPSPDLEPHQAGWVGGLGPERLRPVRAHRAPPGSGLRPRPRPREPPHAPRGGRAGPPTSRGRRGRECRAHRPDPDPGSAPAACDSQPWAGCRPPPVLPGPRNVRRRSAP